MMTDPISDMLIRIKNAQAVGKAEVKIPHSTIKAALAEVLVAEGFIAEVAPETDSKERKSLIVTLKYDENKNPVINGIKRMSKPGRRIHEGRRSIPRVRGGLGTVILSTSQGLMTDREARRRRMGGELICKIW
ncbi:MAG: 30S ribosomal protein S8 [bacterium]